MRHKAKQDLTWNTAPDTLTPNILARILGVGTQKAREMFNDRTFPRQNEELKADKEAVRLWWQGLYRKNEKDSTIGMLLIEQRKTNKLLEKFISYMERGEKYEDEKII